MRKFVRMPPISAGVVDSRGKPLASTPTSVDVPPTSATMASRTPVRYAAPRMLFAGPLPIVRTGWRRAWSSAMSVPSFWAKNVSGRSPCPASAAESASATVRATPTRAAFSTVAFSRSSSPTVPTSWLSEMWTSAPSTARAASPTASSCSAETGAKTLAIATPSTCPAMLSRKRRAVSRSSGTISRPSNSMPPSTISSPAETVSRRSCGHAKSGRIE